MLNRKVALIPCVTATSFVLGYWISNIRESHSLVGLSSDLASGLVFGLGIGISLVIISTLKKSTNID